MGPDDLSDKTIAIHSEDLVGISPKLCSGFQEQVPGSPTYVAGDVVNRVVSDGSTRLRTATQTTYAYNATAGILTAEVNGIEHGSITFSGSDNSGVATSLHLQDESDFWLLDATGAATTFALSIHYPNALSGYRAAINSVTDPSGLLNTGVNSFQLKSTSPTSVATNVLEFVLDPETTVPIISGVGTLAEGTAGTKQYISGVPHYSDSGSAPSLNLTGVQATILTGQCYSDVANPVEVDADTRLEGSGTYHAIADLDFTYANIDGASTMLSSGIPTVNVGVAGAYTLGTLAVPITTSGTAKCVNEIKIMARNCNGTSAYNTSSTTKIQVYNATPTGLDKEDGGIAVSDSLGNGSTHTDDAVRIAGFGALSSDTPSIFDSSNANYYTDSAWTEPVTVAGTNEAICRFGTIGYNIINYSSGYLPAGPNLTTSRDGGEKQYYTFAFRRTPFINFTITMTGTVSGMWVCMPGNSTLDSASGGSDNSWLDVASAYAGSGPPGKNTSGGGNGDNGCASGTVLQDNQAYSSVDFDITFGTESTANTSTNVVLVRILLNSGDSVTALSIS